MQRLILTLSAVCLLAGCATQPVPDTDTKPVPADRILKQALLEAAPNTGVVTVKRDSGFMGGGAKLVLAVDAEDVAELRPAERIVLHLPLGDHILSARTSYTSALLRSNIAETRASVAAGSALTFRVGIAGSGDISISPTSY